MSLNIYNQLFNLLIFIITGIIIGVLFDIFRIIRKSFKTPDVITYIEDVLFWVLTGIILLFTIFTFNSGEIRIYIFIGLAFGLIIYLLTLSKYFINISVKILLFIKRLIYYPLCIIMDFIKKFIFRPISSIFNKIKVKITNKMKNQTKKAKNNNLPNIYNKIDK